jgi:hypothetical protein
MEKSSSDDDGDDETSSNSTSTVDRLRNKANDLKDKAQGAIDKVNEKA